MKKKNDNKKTKVLLIDGEVSTVVNGRRCTPVVNDKGQFFASALLAADVLGKHVTGITYAIRNGTRCGGLRWFRATLDQCKGNGLDIKSALVSQAEAAGEVVVVKKRGNSETSKVEPKSRREINDITFQGHRWSDGAVTVRLGSVIMTRPTEADIPEEILAITKWIGVRA